MKYVLATSVMLSLLTTLPAYANNSDVEIAIENQGGRFSTFHQALVGTGVANELNENTAYTIFAPTNAAFAEIRPQAYPCFYSAQCRTQVAAVLRNHIVPRDESLRDLSHWGSPVPTIGNRGIHVEEAYKNDFTVEGHKVLTRSEGDNVNLYSIDGVIADERERAPFRVQPVAEIPDAVIQKTVTIRRTTIIPPAVVYGHPVPGGYLAAPVIYTTPNDFQDGDLQTTTTTRTTTTQQGQPR